jgi:phage terminase small subunit
MSKKLNQFSKNENGLNKMQQKFADNYNGEGTGTQSAILAGYSPKSAYSTANKLLNHSEVIKYLTKRKEIESKDVMIERKEIIMSRHERQAFWSAVANGEVGETQVVGGTTITVPAKMNDRLKASELLGRSEADFTENTNLNGEVNVKEDKAKERAKDLLIQMAKS